VVLLLELKRGLHVGPVLVVKYLGTYLSYILIKGEREYGFAGCSIGTSVGLVSMF
jgi:hypothetical protein